MTRYGGIDLGGTKIQAVVTDDQHQVLGASRHATPTTGGPAAVAEEIVSAMREATAEAGMPVNELAAGGVGSPGVGDDEAGGGPGAPQPPPRGGGLRPPSPPPGPPTAPGGVRGAGAAPPGAP